MFCSPGPLEQGSQLGYTQGDPTPMALLGATHTASFPGWNGMPVALSIWGYLVASAFFLHSVGHCPSRGLCAGLALTSPFATVAPGSSIL